jgi:hypothetical protein
MRRVFLFVLVLVPTMAAAQDHRWELTPTVGFRWGGTILIDAETNVISTGLHRVDLANGGEYGLRLGFLLSESLGLELMYSKELTEFKDKQGLFGEEPGSTTPPGATGTLNTDVENWQLGLTWTILKGSTRPYLVFAGGQTTITSETPLPKETAFTLALGAGVKVDLSKSLGLLFEVRHSRSDTDQDNTVTVEWEHIDCPQTCRYTYGYDDTFSQTSLTAGLIVEF